MARVKPSNLQPVRSPEEANDAIREVMVWKTFRKAFFALVMPFIIIGGVTSGFLTATESLYPNFSPDVSPRELKSLHEIRCQKIRQWWQ